MATHSTGPRRTNLLSERSTPAQFVGTAPAQGVLTGRHWLARHLQLTFVLTFVLAWAVDARRRAAGVPG